MPRRSFPLIVALVALAYACVDAPTVPQRSVSPSTVTGALSLSLASTSKQISSSWFHGCALDSLRRAWCWGNGWNGELGYPVGVDTNRPVPVTGNRAYSAISTGLHHSCAIGLSGGLWCWGGNGASHTVLGGGTTVNFTTTPQLVPGGRSYVQVSAGDLYTCGVTAVHALYCWGENTYGQLGDGTTGGSSGVENVGAGKTWLMVAAGTYHTCGITTDSTAYCWGQNNLGSLGTGDTVSRVRPVLVKGNHHFARIAVHSDNSCAIDGGGVAWCWGENNYGQLGINSTVPGWVVTPHRVVGTRNWVDIAPDFASTCALTASGNVFCWGQGGYYTGYLDAEDSVPRRLNTTRLFVALGTGLTLSCAQGDDRRFYCWGGGADGMLGNGADTAALQPARVKSLYSVN